MIKKINQAHLRRSRFSKIAAFMHLGIIDNSVFLAGGALRTLIDDKEDVADFDVFFAPDIPYFAEDDSLFEKPLYPRVERTKRTLEREKFTLIFECPKGSLFTYKKDNMKIQLILAKFLEPLEMIQTFDFGACQAAFDGENFFFSKAFIRNVMTKTLSTEFVEFPVATINRLIKYQSKGYNVKTAILDFMKKINGVPFNEENMVLYID